MNALKNSMPAKKLIIIILFLLSISVALGYFEVIKDKNDQNITQFVNKNPPRENPVLSYVKEVFYNLNTENSVDLTDIYESLSSLSDRIFKLSKDVADLEKNQTTEVTTTTVTNTTAESATDTTSTSLTLSSIITAVKDVFNDQGSKNSESGAYLIGTYDEFANSDAINVQDVLDDLDNDILNLENSGFITETSTNTLSNKIIGSTGLSFNGASTDITTGSNEDLNITPNGSGIVKINSSLELSSTIKISGGSPGASKVLTSDANGLASWETINTTTDTDTAGTTSTTSSNSGLETASDGVSLLRGCSDNQILKWDSGSSIWQCEADSGSGGGTLDIEEGDALIVSAASVVDFLASDFTISESPTGEGNISIDYNNSGITRKGGNETISGNWTFTSGISVGSTAVVTNLNADYLDSQSGAYYLSRANHTGTQTASTISDFDTEVGNHTDVSANTSARHSAITVSDTSSVNLTLTDQLLSAAILPAGVDHDSLLNYSANEHLDWTNATSNFDTTGTIQVGTSNVTITNASGYLLESAIADGALLARLSADETVSGNWTFTNGVTIGSTSVVTNLNADYLDSQDGSYYLSRANHTGTQTASTISDFDTEVGNHADVSANTSARHSAITVSDTSSVNLTLTDQLLSAAILPAGVDHDSLLNFVANEHLDWTNATATLSTSGSVLASSVGIGTTNPGYALDIVGELNLTDAIRLSGDAGTSGYLLTSSAGGIMTWTDPASITGTSYSVSGALTLVGDTLGLNETLINHDNLSGFVSNEHLDWTNATSNFDTTGTIQVGTSNVTITNASGYILETSIADGALLARLSADETVSGNWTFTNGITVGSTSPITNLNADLLDSQHGAYYLSRTNHTGTQTASTISDFDTEVGNHADVSANTSARHSAVTVSDTSSVNLTLTDQLLSAAVLPAGVDHDSLLNFVANEHLDWTNATADLSTSGSVLASSVGIGTTDPSYALDIVGELNITDAIRVAGDAGTNGYLLTSSAGGVMTWTNPDSITGTTYSVSGALTLVGDTLGLNETLINHDNLSGFVSDEHVAHTGVTLTAGVGLSGGGDISTNRTFTIDLNELTTETSISAGDFISMVDITDSGSGKITFANLESTLNHDSLTDFVSNEHLDWTNSSSNFDTTGTIQVGTSNVTITNASGYILETAIADGALLARLSADETVTGNWTFTNGISVGSTAVVTNLNADYLDSQSGAYYLSRTNHTGTQTASTISDFDTEVSNNSDVSANTSARHSAITVSDTSSVNLTLTDQLLSAAVIPGGVDHNSLLNYEENRHLDWTNASSNFDTTGTIQVGTSNVTITNASGYLLESAIADGALLARLAANETVSGNWTFTSGISVGSTAVVTNLNADYLDSQSGAYYLSRTNHTGTQTASTISDFDTEVGNHTDVAANTSARHSVITVSDTSSVNLTLTDQLLSAAILPAGVDHDSLLNYVANEHIDWTNATADLLTSGSVLASSIGIGTTDPSYALDIVGELNITDAIRVSGDAGTSGYLLTSSAGGVMTWTNPASITGTTYSVSGALTLVGDTLGLNETLIDHDNLSGFVANEHLDWTNASSNFDTTGTIQVGTSNVTITNASGYILETAIADGAHLARLSADETVTGNWTFTNGISVGSTAVVTNLNADYLDSQSGAYYLSRANHTGTQTASTISDFDTEVGNHTDVAANTSARHSAITVSDTSSVNLTLTDQLLSAVVLPAGVDHDSLLNFVANEHIDWTNATANLLTSGSVLSSSIGIGTTDPSYALDIVGELNITDAIRVAGDAGTNGYVLTSSAGGAMTWTNPNTIGGSAYSVDSGLTLVGSTISLGGSLTANTRVNVGSTEVLYFKFSTGNVGVGNTNPSYKLDVAGDINLTGAIRAGGAEGTSGYLLTSSAGGAMTWTDPNSLIDTYSFLNGLTATGNTISLGGNLTGNTTITQDFGETLTFLNNGSASTIFNLASTGDFDIQDNGVSALWVGSDGNVGIGTTSPQVNLEVGSTNPVLRLTNTQDKSWTIGDVTGSLEFYSADNSGNYPTIATAIKSVVELNTFGNSQGLSFFTNSDIATATEKMRIASNGYVGIGTTNPSTVLDVIGGTGLRLRDVATDNFNKVGLISGGHYSNSEENVTLMTVDSTSNQNFLRFGGGSSANQNAATYVTFFTAATNTTLNGDERMRIDPTGLIGIGTTAPGYALDIVGEFNLTDAIRVSGVAGTTGYLLTSAGGNANTWTDPNSLYSVINGLTLTGSTISLGGALTANTTITQDSAEALTFANTGTGNITFNLSSTGDFNIQDNGVSALFVRDNGTVGIGTTSPGYALDLVGEFNLTDALRVAGSAGTNGYLLTSSAGGANIWKDPLSIYNISSGLTLVGNTISWGGNLTANTTITQDFAETLTFLNNGSGDIKFNLASSGDFEVQDNGATALFVNSVNGNVGIGTTNPTGKFSIGPGSEFQVSSAGTVTTSNGSFLSGVGDTQTAVAFTLNTTNTLSTTGAKLLSVKNNGTEKMYLDADGNLFVSGSVISGSGSFSITSTNNSGGTVANKSIVILDTGSTTPSFTTTNNPYDKSSYGVVVGEPLDGNGNNDGVCNNQELCTIAVAGEVDVLISNTTVPAISDYLFTSDTAGKVVASTKQFDGLVGMVTSTKNFASGYIKMLFKAQPQVSGSPFYSKTGDTVPNGGYIEIVHNGNTNDLLTTGWVYTDSQWKDINNAPEAGLIAVGNTALADGAYLQLTHNQNNLNLPISAIVYNTGDSVWESVTTTTQVGGTDVQEITAFESATCPTGWTEYTDARGKVIVGVSSGESEFDSVGETGGYKTHTLTTAEMPSHYHGVSLESSGAPFMLGYNSVMGGVWGPTGSNFVNTTSVGSGTAHNNLQPYIALTYCSRDSGNGTSYVVTQTDADTTRLYNNSGATQNVSLAISAPAFQVKQYDLNTARLYNYSGSTQKLKLNVVPNGGGGSPASNGLYTNNDVAVADGSYIDVVHNGNTNDLLTTGWIYNTGTSKWEEINTTAGDASGGTVTYTDSSGLNPRSSPPYSGGYTVHTFTSSGTFTPNGSGNVEYLVVGGGGGGGKNQGGGGGAGGYVSDIAYSMIPLSTYSITVGAGGSAGASPTQGSSSSFSSFATAVGGGYGGAYSSATGGDGGSGGGSGAAAGTGTTLGGSGTPDQGNDGGSAAGQSGNHASGGGGGAGASGGNATPATGAGNGGAGSQWSNGSYYAGGGGGGSSNYTGGTGGVGGGGTGGSGVSGVTSGTPNTGGGGGGSGNDGVSGGTGGSGIVIIRYPTNSLSTYKIEQLDANTARLYNYSGSTQNLRLDVVRGAGRNSGTLSLHPLAADTDASIDGNSLWINKTASGGNLMRLQASGTDMFTVTTAGYVGIGTTAPGAKLSIYDPSTTVGRIATFYRNVDDGFGVDMFLGKSETIGGVGIIKMYPNVATPASSKMTFGIYGDNLDTGTGLTILKGGNVGIGTAAPGYKLHIVGSGTTGSTFSIVARQSNNTVNTFYVQDDGAGYLKAAAWTYGSDRRLKENITSIDDSGLDTILKLNPVKFDYLDGGPQNQLGFIAQEVQQIIPEAVVIADERTGYLGLKTNFIIPYLTKAIQEQQLQIEALGEALGNQQISNTGDLAISQNESGDFLVTNQLDDVVIESNATFNNSVIANLRTGSLNAIEAQINNLKIGTQTLAEYIVSIVQQALDDGQITNDLINTVAEEPNITQDLLGNITIGDTNTNVGIGVTNPVYKLQVGTEDNYGFVNDQGAWSVANNIASSDIEITNLENSLAKILDLEPIRFNNNIGFNANDLEVTFPELVSTDPNTGIKGISYSLLAPVLVKGIQEQQLLITGNSDALLNVSGDLTTQEQEIANLEQRIRGLEDWKTSEINSQIAGVATDSSEATASANILEEQNGVWYFIKEMVFNLRVMFMGGVEFAGETIFKDKLTVNKDTAGVAIITAGNEGVRVKFNKEFTQVPLVTLTPNSKLEADYSVEDVTLTGFVIKLSFAQVDDVSFNYLAIMVDEVESNLELEMIESFGTPAEATGSAVLEATAGAGVGL